MTARIAVALLLTAVLSSCGGTSRPPVDPRVVRIQSTYGLVPPYTIDSIAVFNDGGSTEWTVRGGSGQKLTFSWDGGMRPAVPDTFTRLLYVGELHNPADAIPLGSASESTLVDILQLSAENGLGPYLMQRADTIHQQGDYPRYRSLQESLDPEKQRALAGYSLALGLIAQRERGYWRAPDAGHLGRR